MSFESTSDDAYIDNSHKEEKNEILEVIKMFPVTLNIHEANTTENDDYLYYSDTTCTLHLYQSPIIDKIYINENSSMITILYHHNNSSYQTVFTTDIQDKKVACIITTYHNQNAIKYTEIKLNNNKKSLLFIII